MKMEKYQTKKGCTKGHLERVTVWERKDVSTVCFKGWGWPHNVDWKFEFSDDCLKLSKMGRISHGQDNYEESEYPPYLCIYLGLSNKECEPQVKLVHSLDVADFKARSDLRGQSAVGPYGIPQTDR
jgi:hypothetical protein